MPQSTISINAPHLWIKAVGSRITCQPPPTGTDQDWLVLVDATKWDQFTAALLSDGWEVGGSLVPNDENYISPGHRFNSFTKGDDNIIASVSDDFTNRFLAASAVAKRLNLLNKEDRISLFQAVLYSSIVDDDFSPPNTMQTNEIPF